MIRPMPSPAGTNRAGYYILRGRPSPTMAMDAMPSGAEVGRASGGGKDAIKQIVRWACENLNDEETYELSMLLQKAISETPIGGKGNASVVAGMDAARAWGKSYGERFVAARAKPADPTASVGSAEEQYYARFPHARRLEDSSNSTAVTSAASAKPIAADVAAEAAYYAKFPNARRLV